MKNLIDKIQLGAVYVMSFFCGLLVFAAWGAGSHGNFRFRPHMTEDWIIGLLLLLFWGVPLFFIIRSSMRKFF